MFNEERIKELISLAKDALSLRENDAIDDFVASIEKYLGAFESWQKEASAAKPFSTDSSISEEEKKVLRDLLQELNTIHQQLMGETDVAKDNVGQQMGEMHKRASGLKKYVDSLPSRITITGRRKG